MMDNFSSPPKKIRTMIKLTKLLPILRKYESIYTLSPYQVDNKRHSQNLVLLLAIRSVTTLKSLALLVRGGRFLFMQQNRPRKNSKGYILPI